MSNPGLWDLYEHLPPAKNSTAGGSAQSQQTAQPPQAAPKKTAAWQPPFAGGLIPPVKRPKIAPPQKPAAAKRTSATTGALNHEVILKSTTPPPDMVDVAMTDSVVAIEVADPYDPAHPNSFEEYLEEKKVREIELANRERELEDLRAMEREEERLRERDRERNRRTGAAIPPPAIYHQDDEDAVKPSPYAPPSRSSGGGGGSIAEKMMRNMGWKGEGHGLGKNQQGIAAPIAHSRTATGQGVIVAPTPGPIQQDGSKPSKTVLLRNMVGRGQVDDELGPETKGECGRFGRVVCVSVDESTDLTLDDEEAVRIFVQFEALPSAMAAIAELNGRYFAGRKIRASFYDEDRFLAKRYRDIITNA